MLQKLNERVKGLFAWIVVILIAFTFMMFGVDYFLQSKQSPGSVAEVNGEVIPATVFEQVYRRLRHQDTSNLSAPEDAALKKQIVEQLIVNTLTLQAANQAGFFVGQGQVVAALLQIPQFLENGKFSPARYQQVLAASMYTPSALQHEIGQDLLMNQQRFMFVNTDFALPSEIKNYTALLFEKRDYQYAIVPVKPLIEKATVTEAAIKGYYQAHEKQFVKPAQVSLAYVMLTLDQFKKTTTVSDDEVRQYYHENESSFKSPARWKLSHLFYAFPQHATPKQQEAIKEKAQDAYDTLKKSPSLFNEWVKQHSDDQVSARHEGVLPWLTLGQSPFDEILPTLTKSEQISQPFKTKDGYEIFKVLEYIPATTKPFEQAATTIRTQLLNEKAQMSYAKALETLGEMSYQNPDTLEPVSRELQLPILQTAPFTPSGGTEPITQHAEVLRLAFSPDIKTLGNNSEPIQINPTTVIVLRVKKQYPAELEPFQAVKAQIETQLKTNAAKKDIEKLAQSVMNGSLSLPDQYRWQDSTQESRTGETKNPVIRELAFKLSQPKQIDGAYLPTGDYVFVRLATITPGKFESMDQAQRQTITQQLQSAYGTIDYDLYVRGLLDGAKIKRY